MYTVVFHAIGADPKIFNRAICFDGQKYSTCGQSEEYLGDWIGHVLYDWGDSGCDGIFAALP